MLAQSRAVATRRQSGLKSFFVGHTAAAAAAVGAPPRTIQSSQEDIDIHFCKPRALPPTETFKFRLGGGVKIPIRRRVECAPHSHVINPSGL